MSIVWKVVRQRTRTHQSDRQAIILHADWLSETLANQAFHAAKRFGMRSAMCFFRFKKSMNDEMFTIVRQERTWQFFRTRGGVDMKTALGSMMLAAAMACLAGCEQTAADRKADAVRDSANQQAKDIRNETDRQADATRDNANRTADAVRDQAGKDALGNAQTRPAENKADRIEQAGEDRADTIEKSGENAADAVESAGERKADAIEDNDPEKK